MLRVHSKHFNSNRKDLQRHSSCSDMVTQSVSAKMKPSLTSGGSTTTRRRRRPRVGFAGIGWIGKNRLNAIRKADIIELVAVADPHSEALAGVSRELPGVILHEIGRASCRGRGEVR